VNESDESATLDLMPSCAAVSKRYLAVLGVAYSGSLASGDVASKWRNAGFAIGAASSRDVHLHALLTDTIPAALEHTGAASFDEHLTSLQVLKSPTSDPN
jgi:hypothetical protein